MQSTKVDIVYYLTPTDFEMEFNLSGCCRMRLLTAIAHDRKGYVEALSRAVSRSRIILTCGQIYGENGLIYTTAKAIGKPLTLINNKDYGIADDHNVRIIEGSLPLVTTSGLFGGVIIESGPQTIIILSESKDIRRNIMHNLIHPYIQEVAIMEIRGTSSAAEYDSASQDTADTTETPDSLESDSAIDAGVPLVTPDVIPDISDAIGGATAITATGGAAAEILSDAVSTAENTSDSDTETVFDSGDEGTSSETPIKEFDNTNNALPENEELPITVLNPEEEKSESSSAITDSELEKIAESINQLSESINTKDKSIAEAIPDENLYFVAPEDEADVPIEDMPENNSVSEIDFQIDDSPDYFPPTSFKKSAPAEEKQAPVEKVEDYKKTEPDKKPEIYQKASDSTSKARSSYVKFDKEARPVFFFDEQGGNSGKDNAKKGSKGLTVSIIIIAALLLIIIGALAYFLLYVPYSKGISIPEYFKDIFTQTLSFKKFMR